MDQRPRGQPDPVLTDQPQAGWTHTRYGNTGAMAPVEAYSIQGVGHSLPQSGMAAEAIRFFGLNGGGTTTTVTTTPTTTTRPTTTTGPTGGCRVTYVLNPWNTGLTADITIANPHRQHRQTGLVHAQRHHLRHRRRAVTSWRHPTQPS